VRLMYPDPRSNQAFEFRLAEVTALGGNNDSSIVTLNGRSGSNSAVAVRTKPPLGALFARVAE